ncbi:hypothetical protein BS47DRAFT_416181 [Hydnum rufescens UP504]|uniref:Uncharacterized protein n=1 Tax=Hydnum rufescens UP504 TaxID=1448309 RepID=A0A9P6BB46_9AGAM|nr:hypothetical protein BS47DRAFT_416181 [Hydnum rufescens UP504]
MSSINVIHHVNSKSYRPLCPEGGRTHLDERIHGKQLSVLDGSSRITSLISYINITKSDL